MKAMILAAGLGKRMRPLTNHTPKPLLPVAGKPLIQYHIERLRRAGVTELLVNLAYLGEKIREFLGDGRLLGVTVSYSAEPFPLETGGAIAAALPWLGEEPFILVNGDVWTDYPFERLLAAPLADQIDGHLVLVDNPDFNPGGDFSLDADGGLREGFECAAETYTYSGIALLRPALVGDYPERRQKFPLLEVFRHSIGQRRLAGEVFRGDWRDIGTPERLARLDREVQSLPS